MGSIPVAAGERGLFNNDHPVGKGDKERSSKWRKNYQGIGWGAADEQGFVRQGVKQVKTYAAAHTRTHCPGCGRGVVFPVKFVIAECTQCGHKFSLCQECGEPIGRQEVFCKACRVTLNRGEACT